MPVLLTIAGFDPSSGAGITADLAVALAHGLFGISAITALTVQSTVGVRSTHPLPGALLRDTLDVLEADLPPDAIKIGMLATADCVNIVADYLENLHRNKRSPKIVLDPVLRSSSGAPLLDQAGLDLLRDRLLPLVHWATPNLDELAALRAHPPAGPPTKAQIAFEAIALQTAYPKLGLIVTGGHHDPPDDLLLLPASEAEIWLSGQRVHTSSTHGTGCAFSTAFLSNLVQGKDPLAAAKAAKHYVSEAMRQATPRGSGHGPMNLLWPLSSTRQPE